MQTNFSDGFIQSVTSWKDSLFKMRFKMSGKSLVFIAKMFTGPHESVTITWLPKGKASVLGRWLDLRDRLPTLGRIRTILLLNLPSLTAQSVPPGDGAACVGLLPARGPPARCVFPRIHAQACQALLGPRGIPTPHDSPDGNVREQMEEPTAHSEEQRPLPGTSDCLLLQKPLAASGVQFAVTQPDASDQMCTL